MRPFLSLKQSSYEQQPVKRQQVPFSDHLDSAWVGLHMASSLRWICPDTPLRIACKLSEKYKKILKKILKIHEVHKIYTRWWHRPWGNKTSSVLHLSKRHWFSNTSHIFHVNVWSGWWIHDCRTVTISKNNKRKLFLQQSGVPQSNSFVSWDKYVIPLRVAADPEPLQRPSVHKQNVLLSSALRFSLFLLLRPCQSLTWENTQALGGSIL